MAHFYWTKTRLYRESQRTQPQKIWMVGFPVFFFNQHAGTSLHRENEIAHKGLDGPPCRGSSPVRGQGLDLATSAPAGAARRAPCTGWPRSRSSWPARAPAPKANWRATAMPGRTRRTEPRTGSRSSCARKTSPAELSVESARRGGAAAPSRNFLQQNGQQ